MPGKDRFINYINLLILIGLLRCRIFRKIQKVTFFVITKQKLMICYFAWESKKAFLIKNSLLLDNGFPGFNNRTLVLELLPSVSEISLQCLSRREETFSKGLECQRFFAAKPFTFQNRLERSQSLLPQKGVDDFLASGWMKQK